MSGNTGLWTKEKGLEDFPSPCGIPQNLCSDLSSTPCFGIESGVKYL